MSTVQSKPVKLNPYSEIKIGTQVYWYSQGNKNLDPLPAIVIGKIPQTGAADLTVFTRSGPEPRNAVHPIGSERMDNVNIRRNGGWSPKEDQ